MKVVESRVANLLLYGSELIGSMRLVFMDGYLPIYFYRAVVDVILTAQRRCRYYSGVFGVVGVVSTPKVPDVDVLVAIFGVRLATVAPVGAFCK